MPGSFSYNYDTINDCNSATGFTVVDGVGELGGSNDDYSGISRHQTDVTNFSRNGAGWGGIRADDLGTGDPWDMTSEDFTWHFLYTAKTGDYLANSSCVAVRVRSSASGTSTDWAEWILTGAVVPGEFFPVLQKTWNPFILSGSTGDRAPDSTNGTPPTYTAIRHIECRWNWIDSNNGQSEPSFATDWWKLGTEVTITNGSVGAPADFPTYVSALETPANGSNVDGQHGVIFGSDVFYETWSGVRVGNGSTTTYFAAENTFIYNNQYSDQVQHDITVASAATLRVGKKDVGTDATYAINGCQLVCRTSVTADITIQSGGDWKVFASKVFRYNDLSIQADATVSIIDCDFDSIANISIAASAVTIRNSKFHDPSGSGYIGTIAANVTLDGAQVFNCTRGFQFSTDVTLRNYVATDNTYDMVLSSGVTATLINSTFDPDKILQVA